MCDVSLPLPTRTAARATTTIHGTARPYQVWYQVVSKGDLQGFGPACRDLQGWRGARRAPQRRCCSPRWRPEGRPRRWRRLRRAPRRSRPRWSSTRARREAPRSTRRLRRRGLRHRGGARAAADDAREHVDSALTRRRRTSRASRARRLSSVSIGIGMPTAVQARQLVLRAAFWLP